MSKSVFLHQFFQTAHLICSNRRLHGFTMGEIYLQKYRWRSSAHAKLLFSFSAPSGRSYRAAQALIPPSSLINWRRRFLRGLHAAANRNALDHLLTVRLSILLGPTLATITALYGSIFFGTAIPFRIKARAARSFAWFSNAHQSTS
jgi:hypothetical protein